ncbi:MAG: reverse transcriptase family protein, partial [Planctomycetes bacterium]|nr:reverse transcriptase family protein [Planctomycetota bacterium]
MLDRHLVLPTTPRAVAQTASIPLTHGLLTIIKTKEELLSPTTDTNIYLKEPQDIADILPSTSTRPTVGVNEIDLIRIEGTPELRLRIRQLCEKYRHIFSTTLRENPSRVKPMELKVDLAKWYVPRNRRPYRVQSRNKEDIIRKLVNQLLALKLIRPSKATAWSQVLIVPKPEPGTWRLCIDYRQLNDVSDGEHWPLPNIQDVIDRIGQHRSKIFGKMDFTSGFWQARLSESSMKYTAFTTFMGLYEFTVVAMGLKGAPSFFQSAMATEVLGGDLLYTICELYIDDVVVHGDNDESFLNNLERLLKRYDENDIILHPKKCSFGMAGVEFVGHLIDGEGKRMSPEKIQRLLDYTKPESIKELRSFL